MEKENKNCIISFRVTPEEKKWIEYRSYGHYQLISDFVRDCVFKKEMVIITGAVTWQPSFAVSETMSTSSHEPSTRDLFRRSI